MTLDVASAREAMSVLAANFKLSTEAMASGIHRIINERMANEIRLVSVKRGYDPRQFALVALGGAGPVHGARLAHLLSIPCMVVPEAPGVLCAFGLLVADIEHEQTRTFGQRMSSIDPGKLQEAFDAVDALCAQKMSREGVDPASVRSSHFIDVRYVGQSYELEVPINGPIDRPVIDAAIAEFHALHRRIYGYARPSDLEAINLRAVQTVKAREYSSHPGRHRGSSLPDAQKGTRLAYFDDIGRYDPTPVYDRHRLPIEVAIDGPAIIEQPDTTTVVYPGQQAQVDVAGNLIVSIPQGGKS
jgi:N-methylhydantoinase A